MNDGNKLIKKAKAGDVDAFEQLVLMYLVDIRCFTAMHFPERHKVDEICQEVFIFAFQKLNTFDKGSFKAWLKAIAFNKVRQEKKRLSRQQSNLINLKEFLILKQAPENINPLLSELQGCVEQLAENQRELIRLKYVEHLSTEQLAVTTGRTGSWVRSTLCRLRIALKKCINNKGQLLT